MTEYSLCH